MVSMFRQEYADLAIFNGLQASQIRALSPFLEEIALQEGETVFEQGESACCLFILLAGEVSVRYKPYDGPPLTVARIQAGEVFGWSAALGREVYTSNAEVVRTGVAYRVRAKDLRRLCEFEPEAGSVLLERLADSIAERLRNTNSSILELLNQGVDRKCNGSKRSDPHE
jgi:CRP/FNR family transcriptional regulator, cyclic AMP receptor protein